MKKTELTTNDIVMAAMAIKFLGDTGAFKKIDLHAAKGRSEDAATIEEITELYVTTEQKTLFDAFKTTEAFTDFMQNHVFDGNEYTAWSDSKCEKQKDSENESNKTFEDEFKLKTAEAILFLAKEDEEIREELNTIKEQIKAALKLFIATQEEA
jgi:regulatory protein YycI of two-component signal transduction system YycFG